LTISNFGDDYMNASDLRPFQYCVCEPRHTTVAVFLATSEECTPWNESYQDLWSGGPFVETARDSTTLIQINATGVEDLQHKILGNVPRVIAPDEIRKEEASSM